MIGLGSDFCSQQLHLSGIPFNERGKYISRDPQTTQEFLTVLKLKFSSKEITTALKVRKISTLNRCSMLLNSLIIKENMIKRTSPSDAALLIKLNQPMKDTRMQKGYRLETHLWIREHA